MIDKLHFKAYLRDFYLNPSLYQDDYEVIGRGEYIRYLVDADGSFDMSYENISHEEHLAIKADTPHLTRFILQRFSLLELGIQLSAGIIPRRKADGTYDHKNFDAEKVSKYWESIPSSYAGLAFKLHDYRDSDLAKNLNCPVFVEFHASPAKLLQGHNVYGSDDIVACKDVLLDVLLNAYPQLQTFFDFDNLILSSLDLTYFSRANSQQEAEFFIDAIGSVSRGQTKSRTGYKGATAYFGSPRSKLKKLKVYAKYLEVMGFVQKLQASLKTDLGTHVIPIKKIKDLNLLKIYTQDLLDFTLGMIRWEATIKSDWLRVRGYSLHFNSFIEQFDPQKMWQESFKDLFFLLESKTMSIPDYADKTIRQQLRDTFVTYDKHGKPRYTSAENAYKTFLLIKERGFKEAMDLYRVATSSRANQLQQKWYAHLQMLRDIGLTDIYLQSFSDGQDPTAQVVPLLIFSQVDFNAQFPPLFKAA